MIQQGFSIGNRDWYVMVQYDIHTTRDLDEAYKTLLASGCPDYKAQRACMVLSRRNTGYTFTNFKDHLTVVFISRATNNAELFNTINHEIKHISEHIGEYYDVDSSGETSAYLQGEISKQMYPAAALVICPKCND